MSPEQMTEFYFRSYNKALEMTKNPNLAMQIAMAVLLAKQQQKTQENPLEAMIMATMSNLRDANKDKTQNDKENEHDGK